MKSKSSTGADIPEQPQDIYQQRYEHHQVYGKKQQLVKLMQERHSQRRYDDKPIPQDLIDQITDSCRFAPSSCDRFGVRLKVITGRDEKAILNGLMVGGVGWLYRSPVVILLLADPRAYKAGDEITYMPFLDAGVLLQQMSLMAYSLGLNSAYVNPNIRDNNLGHFKKLFTPKGWDDCIPCGALSVGFPHPDKISHERNLIDSLVVER